MSLLILLILLGFVGVIVHSVPSTHRTPVLTALAAVLGSIATVLR